MKLFEVAFLAALFGLALSKKSYEGYKVITVEVPNTDVAEILKPFEDKMDFWTPIIIGKGVDILIPPNERDLMTVIMSKNLKYSVMIEDLEDNIIKREAQREAARAASDSKQGFDLNVYHTYDEIQAFLSDTAANFATCSLENIGQTWEGRDMNVLKICSGNCGDKPVMYIECNIHAREWLTDAVCLNIINYLTADVASGNNQYYADNLDWYILTPANPDGYEYSWTDDRYWRKTRSQFPGQNCVGTDPNRNWDDHFDQGGASDASCSDTYHGPYAFSENNTQNVRDFVLANAGDIAYFMDLHAYSQLAMYPYGWTEVPCADDSALFALCTAAETAMEATHGVFYECGPIATTIYVASGSAVDWAYDIAGVMRSFTIETRPASAIGGGFDPPESEIQPTSEEIWNWHKAVADDVLADPPAKFRK